MNEVHRRAVEAVEIDVLRRSSRTTRLQWVLNNVIKERMRLEETIIETASRQQLI